MLNRKPSFRFALTLVALIAISTITATANWGTNWNVLEFLGITEATSPISETTPESTTAPEPAPMFADSKTVCAGGDFATMALAVADANAAVPAGGRDYLVCAGHTETAPAGGFVITASGSTAANPVRFIKDGVGVNPTFTAPTTQTVGSLHDAIFEINGADYITLDGFTMMENPANFTTTAASNNMTEWGVALLYATTTNGAQNNTISNNTIDLDRTYQNTFGIYSNSTHAATTVTTSATATTTAGANSGLKVYGNTITDVNFGILVHGPSAAADYNNGVDIGGVAPATANIITNFGRTSTFSGYANVSGTGWGVLIRNSTTVNFSYNTLTSSAGGFTGGGSTTFRGVYVPSFNSAPSGSFTNSFSNNTISLTSGVSGILQGITVESSTTTATSTTIINNNNFTAFTSSVASSGASTVISQAGSAVVGPLNHSISNNTFTNITGNTTGSFTFISNSWVRPTSGVGNISNNSIVTGFNKTGAGGIVTLYSSNSSSGPTVNEFNVGNNFSNITVTGATTIAGWASTDGGSPIKTVTGNTFANWTGGTSAVTGLNVGFSGSANVSANTVNNISCNCTLTGIATSSGIQTFSKNLIHTLAAGSGSASGLTVSGGTTVTIHNNLIGNLTANSATSDDSVRGISITSTTASSAINVYYNSIYLNASTGGTNFGSSGVFHTSNATATTAALNLRNNIIVNTSFRNGSGATAALRRSGSGVFANFATTSNNNLLYAGSPSGTNLIYYDGSNTVQTLGAYKTLVSPRDSASITENPPFLSTVGSNANFLHINPATPTQIESGGANIATFTDDYDGNARHATTPDIGADEFTGTPALPMSYVSSTTEQQTGIAAAGAVNQAIIRVKVVTSGSISPISVTSLTLNANGTTDIADINAATAKVYYTGASTTFSTGTLFGQTTPTIANFVVAGSTVLSEGDNYFWLAYDVGAAAMTGNFIDGECNSVTVGGTPQTPTVTAPAGNKSIVGPLSGTYNIGSGFIAPGYTTLTDAIADLHLRGVSSAVTFQLIAGYTSGSETFPMTINQFTGASAANTLTIKPASGATNRVISGSAGGGALFRLNGADYVTVDGSNSGGTDRNLTITNTSTTSPTAVSLVSLGAGLGATNNTIKNTNISTGVSAATGYGVSVGTTPGVSGADNDNTTIQNNNISVATVGIYAVGTASVSAGGNDNLSVVNNTIDSNTTIQNYGIQVGNGLTSSISGNTVSVQTSGAFQPTAISLEGGFVGSGVNGNTITKALATNTGGYGGRGITVGTGTASSGLSITNNVIYGVNGSNWSGFSNSSSMGIGIGMIGGSTTITTVAGGINLYHNSVSMTGSMGAGSTTAITTALYVGSGASALNIRNNVFSNTQAGIGLSQKNYAIYSAAANTAFTAIDFNDYWVSNSFNGPSAIPGFIGSDRTTLGAVQTGFGSNLASFITIPSFNNPLNDLRPQLGSALVGVGDNTTGVTLDILGVTRATGTPPTGPTVGAYENAVDVTGPVIAYTAVGNTTSLIDRTFSASVSDASGVPTSGMGVPVLWFRKNGAGAYNSSNCLHVSGSNYDCTFTYASVGGVTVGDSIQYYIAAQDLASTPNVSSNPSTGATGAVVNPPNFATATTTPNAYAIVGPPLSGDYTVGVGGAYTTLTAAVADYNLRGVSADTRFLLTDALYNGASGETFPIIPSTSSASGPSASATLTIQPNGAMPSVTLSGSSTSGTIVIGDQYVRINGDNTDTGSVERNLTIENTGSGTNSYVVGLFNFGGAKKANNATIRYTNVVGGSTSVATNTWGILLNGAGGDYDNVLIDHNKVWQARVGIGHYGVATTGVNNGNSITNNIIGDATSSNSSIKLRGIEVAHSDNLNISGNEIFGFAAGNSNATQAGVFLSTGSANNNVSANNIHDFYYTGTGGLGTYGIIVGANSGTTNVRNNMIYAIKADGDQFNTATDIFWMPAGIALTAAMTGVNIDNNSIYMSGATLGPNFSGGQSACISAVAGSTGINIRNNALRNSQTTSSAPVAGNKTYAIATLSGATSAMFGVIDNNDYFVDGINPNVGALTATDRTTLGDWQAASGQDAASIDTDPEFRSISDLHIMRAVTATASGVENVGVAIAGVTVDYDGDTRDLATPDIGADEVKGISFTSATYSTTDETTSVAAFVKAISVTRAADTGSAATIAYATVAGGTATGAAACAAGVDYEDASGTLNFAAGETTKTFDVGICSDNVYEGNETINLSLTNAGGGSTLIAPDTAVLTITDDEAVPSISVNDVEFNTPSVVDNKFTVTLSGPSAQTITVNYATSDLSPTAGAATGAVACAAGVDYESQAGTLQFDPGDTVMYVTVPICVDTIQEPNETFTFTLSSASNASIADATGTGTISSEDTATASVGTPAAQEEGTSAAVPMLFPVSLTTTNSVDTVINYTLLDGTATVADNDFADGGSGSITIPAGQLAGTITITIIPDTLVEPDEDFSLSISSPNVAIGTGTATGTILNDDCVTPPSGMTAWYDGSDSGTAQAANDIGGVNDGTMNGATFAAGRVGQGFSFDGNDHIAMADSPVWDLGTENFTIDAWINTPGVTGTPQRILSAGIESGPNQMWTFGIVDSGGAKLNFAYWDQAPTYKDIFSNPLTITPNQWYHVAVVRSGTTVTFYLDGVAVGGGTIGAAVPLNASSVGGIIGARHNTTFTIYEFANGKLDEIELFKRALGATEIEDLYQASGAGKCHTSTLQMSAATGSVTEAGTATFTVTRDGANDSAVDVTYATADGTATGSADATCDVLEDFIRKNGVLAFAVGQSSNTISVDTCSDTIYEGNEDFTLTLSTPVTGAATVGTPATETMTITDDDGVPTVSVDDHTFTLTQSAVGEGFTITLSNPSATAVTVPYSTLDVTATGGASCPGPDYVSLNSNYVFAPGETSKLIEVEICTDNTVEPIETFQFNLGAPTGATILDGQGIGTITSEDATSASIGDVTLSEGNAGPTTFSFPVTLTNPVATAVTINYTVNAGTATTPSDYTSSGSSIIIPANTTGPVNIDVAVNGDTTHENNEAFTVVITSGDVTIGTGTGTGTINNDDAQPTVSVNNHTFAAQSGLPEGFTVSLSGNATDLPVTVNYQTNDVSATGGGSCSGYPVDYVSRTGMLTFNPGTVSLPVDIDVCPDNVQEPTETFTLDLSLPTGAAAGTMQGTGTIPSDDSSTASIGTPAAQNEGNSLTTTMSFPVTLDIPVSTATTINYVVTPGSATTPSDYTVGGTSIIIPANTTGPVNIDITINGDTDYEADESFSVAITPVGVGTGTGSATGTILNDDNPPGTLVVTNTNDDDGICLPGNCSLRQAINSANANADLSTINFAIPASDPSHLYFQDDGNAGTVLGANRALTTESNDANILDIDPDWPHSWWRMETYNMPAITTTVYVDGYSQAGAVLNTGSGANNAVLRLELNGVGGSFDNTQVGLYLNNSSGSTIRGLAIFGFGSHGVRINGGSGNEVSGNYIGTDISGTLGLYSPGPVNHGNKGAGVFVGSSNNTIGGLTAEKRNVISGNAAGINIVGVTSANNVVRGNLIGTNAAGTGNLGNGVGIAIQQGANANQIGGSMSGARNAISGNGAGIGIQDNGSINNVIYGNYIGTAVDGVAPLGNLNSGIFIEVGPASSGNTIGGVGIGEGNIIANSGTDGVNVNTAGNTKNSIRGNSIYNSANILGIGLDGDGVTPNDAGDGDAGPNNLQNFPVITQATVTGSTNTIKGTLNTNVSSAAGYAIDFYSNPSCDGTGYGEGRTYLGSVTTSVTDINGDVVPFVFHPTSGFALGDAITATATDSLGNTSEFSQCSTVVAGTAGDIEFSSATYAGAEGTATTTITFKRTGGSDGIVSATFAANPGTAGAGDYTFGGSPTITFADGDVTDKTRTITITDDNIYEGSETVDLTLSSTAVTLLQLTATLNIADNDTQPVVAFSQANYNGPEGSTAVITVTRTGAPGNAITVDYATGGGDATGGGACGGSVDYISTGGTITLDPLELSDTFSVVLCTDVTTEAPPETIGLTLMPPTGGAVLGLASATLSIIDPVVGGTGYESDVAGGTGPPIVPPDTGLGYGDGVIDGLDLARARALVSGAATSNPAINEFQRVDSAPYVPGGDGRLTGGDITVLRRFINGDLAGILKPAAGPVSPVMFAPLFEEYDELGRLIDNTLRQSQISVVSGEAQPGTNVTIAVALGQRGVENAYGYTIHFDPETLRMVQGGVVVSAASAVNGGTLTVNYNDAANGNIGILFDMPPGQVVTPTEARHTLLFTFTVRKSAAAGQTPITFTSDIAEQYLSDMNGDPLLGRFAGGSVTVITRP